MKVRQYPELGFPHLPWRNLVEVRREGYRSLPLPTGFSTIPWTSLLPAAIGKGSLVISNLEGEEEERGGGGGGERGAAHVMPDTGERERLQGTGAQVGQNEGYLNLRAAMRQMVTFLS